MTTGSRPPLEWPALWRWPRVDSRLLHVGFVCCGVILLGAITGSIYVAIVAAVFAFVCFTLWHDSRSRYRPSMLVNAVTLTTAEELPPDSWVYFLRERRRSVGLIMVFGVLGLSFGAIGVIGLVATPADKNDSTLVLRIVSVGITLFAMLFIYAAVRTAIGRKRLGSFGERPLGIALGQNALLLVTVAGVEAVAWNQIVSVRAEQLEQAGTHTRDRRPMKLNLRARRADGTIYPITIVPESSDVHPWVTFTAISLAVTNAEFRESLGSAAAQTQLDAWAAYAATHKP